MSEQSQLNSLEGITGPENINDLVGCDENSLREYICNRLNKPECTIPFLDSRIEEQPEDIFINALYIEPESNKTEKYRKCLIRVIASCLEAKDLNNWAQGYFQSCPDRSKGVFYNYVLKLIQIAKELGDECLGETVYDVFKDYLFPPRFDDPKKIELDLLGLITVCKKDVVKKWWKEWIHEMDIEDGRNEDISEQSMKVRLRFPTVMYGLISTNPEYAIKYLESALQFVKEKKVTNMKRFVQDVVKGLIFYIEDPLKAFSILKNKFLEMPLEYLKMIEDALKSLTCGEERIQEEFKILINEISSYVLINEQLVHAIFVSKSGIGDGTNYVDIEKVKTACSPNSETDELCKKIQGFSKKNKFKFKRIRHRESQKESDNLVAWGQNEVIDNDSLMLL